MADMTWVCHNI
jgi:hypothetical protein